MKVLHPPALRPSGTIGIVSTSSPVSPAELGRLTGYLRGRGYQVKLADGVTDRLGHFAGTPERRAAGGGFPIVTNVPCGHQPRRLQLAVGCSVALNLDGHVPVLRYEEDLVAS